MNRFTATRNYTTTMILVIGAFLASVAISFGDSPTVVEHKPHIVFMISEDPDNYEAHKTVPVFADQLRKSHNFQVTVLLGNGPRGGFNFPGLEALQKADLLVVFCRRVALSAAQMQLLKEYLKKGNPVIGLRTANHAFSVREEVHSGFESWPGFVSQILGCENRGYGPTAPGTEVAVASGVKNHPILQNIEPQQWHSTGNVYHVAPLLDKEAAVLLTGTVEGKVEPIAWTRMTADNSRVFYTSLGYPKDFEMAPFRKILFNAIYWALDRRPEGGRRG